MDENIMSPADVIREFQTEIDATPVNETSDVLISAIKDNERYFPQSLNFSVLRNPGLALANFSERELAMTRAALAKLELIELSQIPRWRERELKQVIADFEQLKIYVDAHLSLSKKGYLIDKITKISKIISYQANVPNRAKRLSLFGGMK